MRVGVESDAWKAEEAAAWLSRVGALKARAAAARESMEQARSMMLPQGVSYDGGGGPGCYADALPDGVARVQELAARYAEELSALVDEEARAVECIESMPTPLYRAILRMHYLCGMTWAKTADEAGYSLRSVMAFRRAALAELWPLMPAEERTPRHPAL